jgi:hypothetical protein
VSNFRSCSLFGLNPGRALNVPCLLPPPASDPSRDAWWDLVVNLPQCSWPHNCSDPSQCKSSSNLPITQANSTYGQLCWHNEDLIQYLISQARAMLRAAKSQPGSPARFISVTQNDVSNCCCSRPPSAVVVRFRHCRTLGTSCLPLALTKTNSDLVHLVRTQNMLFCQDPEEKAIVEANGGAMIAPMLAATNRVAEAIADEFPTVLVDTFAYTNTLQVPTNMTPRDNVIIRVCTAECNFAAPLEDPVNAHLAKAIQEWANISKQLSVWDYTINFRNPVQPFPDWFATGQNLQVSDDIHVCLPVT